jgi:hypothetical protein
MIKIKLTQEPYITGYYGSFFPEYDEKGKASTEGWWGAMYTAQAVDDDGNEYEVLWKIINDEGPEDSACDWNNPVMILDEKHRNITKKVILEVN